MQGCISDSPAWKTDSVGSEREQHGEHATLPPDAVARWEWRGSRFCSNSTSWWADDSVVCDVSRLYLRHTQHTHTHKVRSGDQGIAIFTGFRRVSMCMTHNRQ